MKTIVLLFLAFSSMAFAQETKPAGAWMPVTVQWRHAPANVDPNLSTASTRVLYFQQDGKMSVIGCVVYRRSGHHSIGAEGGMVSLGEWHEERGRIVARSRLVCRPVPKAGEELPGPWVDDVLIPKEGRLLMKGVLYRRVPDLDKGAAELMPQHGQP